MVNVGLARLTLTERHGHHWMAAIRVVNPQDRWEAVNVLCVLRGE
jgi:hypothetical protein